MDEILRTPNHAPVRPASRSARRSGREQKNIAWSDRLHRFADAAAARSFGIDVSRYQILAFIIGTAIAGLAGGIYAHRMGYIASSDFAFTVSIQILSMVVIGGIGTIRGPILGALLLSVLPEALRFVSDFVSDYRSLVYGGLLVLMVRFMPGGLFGSSSPIVRGSLWVFRKITGKGGAAA